MDIRAYGDRLAPDLRQAFYEAVGAVRALMPEWQIAQMIARNDVAGLVALANQAAAVGLLASPTRFAGILTLLASQTASVGLGGGLELALNRAAMWAEANAGLRIRWIADDIVTAVQGTVQAAVARSLRYGVHPRNTAKVIKSVVGLLPQHQTAADNYLEGLLDRGVPEDRAHAMHAKYADRLLRYRADMITRTETIGAAHAGQYAGWMERAANGLIRPGATVRWIVTEDDRLCERCEPMDDVEVPLGEMFIAHKAGPGTWAPGPGSKSDKRLTVLHPPLHPNCRCTVAIVHAPRNAEKPPAALSR